MKQVTHRLAHAVRPDLPDPRERKALPALAAQLAQWNAASQAPPARLVKPAHEARRAQPAHAVRVLKASQAPQDPRAPQANAELLENPARGARRHAARPDPLVAPEQLALKARPVKSALRAARPLALLVNQAQPAQQAPAAKQVQQDRLDWLALLVMRTIVATT